MCSSVSRNEPTQEMANYISIQRCVQLWLLVNQVWTDCLGYSGEYELKYVEGSLMSDDTCMRAGLAYAKVCAQMIAVMGGGCVMVGVSAIAVMGGGCVVVGW